MWFVDFYGGCFFCVLYLLAGAGGVCGVEVVEELMAFFSDAFFSGEMEEFSERAVCSLNDEVVVLDEDHVGDGVKRGFPFLDGAPHFFFGLFAVGDVFDDQGDSGFSIVEGGGDVSDAEVVGLVVLEVVFFGGEFCSVECFFCVDGEFWDLEERGGEGMDCFSDDIGSLGVDEFEEVVADLEEFEVFVEECDVVVGEGEEGGKGDAGGGEEDFCGAEGEHFDVSGNTEDVEVFGNRVSVDVDFAGDVADGHSFRVVF